MESSDQGLQYRSSVVQYLFRFNTFIILLAIFGISCLMSSSFYSEENLFNLLRQLTPLLLVSLGMLMVISTGGIDLSVGSVAAAGGLFTAVILPYMPSTGGFGLGLAVILAISLGAVFGTINGLLVTIFGLAPFIVTLAMMTVARGITYMMSNGQPIELPDDSRAADILNAFGSGGCPFLHVPWPVVSAVFAIGVFFLVMNNTVFGRMVIATGSNETAVRLAGISEKRFKFSVYVISGALSAAAGVVYTARTGVGTPVTGTGLELDAIATCVIGGALLSGGKASVSNTVMGVLILGLIGNIMNLLSVPIYPQQIIKGAIIVIAVLLQRFGGRS